MSKKYIPATAPFNFIPLPEVVIERYKSVDELPTHDKYYKQSEGFFSGEISYEVKVDEKDPASALMICDGKKGVNNNYSKEFFRNNQDEYAIPGSSMRGLIKTNVQILGLCQSKFDIADTRYLYRDWTSIDKRHKEHYRKLINLKQEIGLPGNVCAGYIYQDSINHYTICPAKKINGNSFYYISEIKVRKHLGTNNKVHYMYTDRILNLDKDKLKDTNELRKCQNKEYTPYYTNVTFSVDVNNRVTGVDLDSKYKSKGTLMCSGFIQKKKAHYVMNEMDKENNAEIELKDKDIRAYIDDLNRKKEKEELYKLPKKIGEAYKKPVFYVKEDDNVYFGMTPYLRVFYKNSVWSGIHKKLDMGGIDYADSIFGFTSQKHEINYKSRVGFSDAVAVETPIIGEARNIVLGEPKPTSYSQYLVQESESPSDLVSYADKFEIRGIKQYWFIDKLRECPPNSKDNVTISIKPVTGGIFGGKVYFENLSKDELGLLTYAISLQDDAKQSLGLAKPYGYGKVQIQNIVVKTNDFEKMYDYFVADNSMDECNVEELINGYKNYVNTTKEIEVDKVNSVSDFMYMRTKKLKCEYTEYQELKEFSNKRVLPTVQNYLKQIEDYFSNKNNYEDFKNNNKPSKQNYFNKGKQNKSILGNDTETIKQKDKNHDKSVSGVISRIEKGNKLEVEIEGKKIKVSGNQLSIYSVGQSVDLRTIGNAYYL